MTPTLVLIVFSFVCWRYSNLLPSIFTSIRSYIPFVNRNDSSSSNGDQQQQQQQQQQQDSNTDSTDPSITEVISTEPLDPISNDTSISTTDTLVKINIIQNECNNHRQFKKASITTVLDLKKYFYRNDIANGKRVIFIFNGRSMVDGNNLMTHYPLLFANSNDPTIIPSIHCMIKEQLTSDQVSNDPNAVRGSASGSRASTRTPLSAAYTSHHNNMTWMNTKSLFIFTGLFLILIWTLHYSRPSYFDLFSSLLLFIFTVCWGFSFYSSIKSTSINNNIHNLNNNIHNNNNNTPINTR